jgi:diadenosine tetraphosphate (Ap4A) HIT family hydrolase
MTPSSCPFCQKLARLGELGDDEVIAPLAHSVVLLGPWQFYRGYCIVVARRHATELSGLSATERPGYLDEMCRVAKVLEDCFHPHKLNYELLGNQVPHLHWHLFPRYRDDPEALKSVWLALERADRDPVEKERLQGAAITHSETARIIREKLSAAVH